ncbi:unnamed protein product [Schistocephalus solidus]|uniref:RING-type domain-containing protein n=1 Tax=Schistocephalus solidus TaxID=70667 RepID=A0A183TNU3_SCHSO|nr:unnamed protein product [Schistocephalus solidus]
MGLCKCERKKVTNLFCFEHRVNVCEFCLISNHPRCIVKSYLYWLKESDYSSVCALCSKPLDDESSGECVRLMCLDIFHWQCLDKHASELPATTASAGYECPLCSQSIIPLSNQGGPLAEALRAKLSTAKWMKPNFQMKSAAPRMKTNLPEPPNNDFRPTTVPIEPIIKGEASVESLFERQRHRDDSVGENQISASLLRPPRLVNADEDDKYRRRSQAGTFNQFLGYYFYYSYRASLFICNASYHRNLSLGYL